MTDAVANTTAFSTMMDYSFYYMDNDTFSPCDYSDVTSFSKDFLATLYSIVFILGFLGNGLVVCVLLKHRRQTNMTDMCLFNLAVSDLLFVLTLPFYTHYVKVGQWTLGDFMCRFISLSHQTGFFSSIFFMVVMTLDRYMVIMHAHKALYYRTMRASIILWLFVWMMSLFVSLPSFVFTRETNDSFGQGCSYSPEDESWILYEHLAKNVLGLIIPLLVMVFCYSRIIPKLVTMKTAKRHRVVKLIISIVAIFFLLWTPYNIVLFLKFLMLNGSISNGCNQDRNLRLLTVVTEALAYTHCCLNPIIYAFVGQKFMKRVLQLLKLVHGTSWYDGSSRKSSVISRSSENAAAIM